MPLKSHKTSYNAGLLSGYMDGREDINKYFNGCSKLINATVLPHGGVTKRPGTEYIATAPGKANLLPFEFSVDDALILEFSNLLTRFYKNGVPIYKPYGTEDLSDFDSATGDSSLVAHWLLNDNLATTAVLDDTVAGSHDGTAEHNTDTYSAPDESGTANKAFVLNDIDEFVTVGDDVAFSFGDGTDDSPFSIALWVQKDTTSTVGAMISKYVQASTDREWAVYSPLTDTIVFEIYDETNNKSVLVTTNDALLDDDKWHFVVCTYSGIGGESAGDGLKIYVDWVERDTTKSQDAGYVAMSNESADVFLGGAGLAGGVALWKGSLNNIAVFSKELSAFEVASLVGADSTIPYSMASPYTAAQAFQFHITQSADVMYLAHEDIHPQKLSRLADKSWKIENVPFTGGPFLDENIIDTHLIGFARTGGVSRSGYYFPAGATGTLTATAHSPFKAEMVDGLWLVKHTRTADNTTSSFATDDNTTPTATTYASHAIRTKGNFTLDLSKFAAGTDIIKLWRKQGNGEWQEFRTFTVAVAFSSTEDEDDVYYAVTRQGAGATVLMEFTAKNQVNRGVVKITAFTSSTVVTVEVIDPVLSNNSDDDAVTTPMWAEGAWSDYRGYPRTVIFFEDRLWWASSTNNPDTLWSSRSGKYEEMDFTDLGLDDDAIIAPLRDNEVSQIQWMQARQVMAVGAANKEYRFGASDPDKPVTPSDRKATPQTGFSSDDIQPVVLNDTIFFFQRNGKKLGAMKFDSITENFDVEDATLLAYKLFDSAPTNMAVQRVPDSLIWTVRADGILPTFTYEPAEEVSGWAEQLFGNSADVDTATGYVESVAVIHGSAEDEVWVCVRRVINTATVYYVEKFKPRDWGSDIEDACFVDSAITSDTGSAVSTVTAAHLKGETVSVFADGVVFDDAVANVSTGVVTLKLATVATQAEVVQCGLPYTMKARTMRLALPPSPQGTIQTRIKRINSTVVRHIRSLLGSAGQEYGGTEYLQDIGATYSTSSADTPEDARLTEGGFNEDAYTTIVSDDPVPFTALSTVTSFEVEERR